MLLRDLVSDMVLSDFSLHENLLGADYICKFLGCSLRNNDTDGAQGSAFATRPLGDSDVVYILKGGRNET